jgi:hypothetical protein
MTQILFKDNKFWIDGMEIVNPDIIPGYTIMSHKGANGDTFPFPENCSYEIACNYDCCDQNGACEHCQKPVIRLKLKDMKDNGKIRLGVPEYGNQENESLKIISDLEAQLVKATELTDTLRCLNDDWEERMLKSSISKFFLSNGK